VRAGYEIVAIASARNEELVRSFGAAYSYDRISPSIMKDVIALAPFHAGLASVDPALDQLVLGMC